MLTNPSAEQNKNFKWSAEIPGKQSGRRGKGLRWREFVKKSSLKLSMKD